MRRGEHDGRAIEHLLLSRGLIARIAGPLFRTIDRSWQIYPVGFLFGLGFDTASEIALLALAAGAAASALPLTSVLALPVLFAAGMSPLGTHPWWFLTS